MLVADASDHSLIAMHHYCTYFDSRFLVRALALHDSLKRHAGPFVLFGLCFDKQAYDAIKKLNDDTFRPIALETLEKHDPALLATKKTRSRVEYYFTCTPALPRFILEQHRQIQGVSYVDADLYFFADPKPLYDELGDDNAVLIIAHRYPPSLLHHMIHGKFNVGMVHFKNNQNGKACLDHWYRSCLDWCYERVEENRYADQKYLDFWQDQCQGVVSLKHLGGNLAPWNLANYNITCQHDHVHVNHDPLIFFHFHRLKLIAPYLYDHGLHHYGVTPTPTITRHIYAPYLRKLRMFQRKIKIGKTDNLRLATPQNPRQLLRTLLYDHTLLNIGTMSMHVHLEPWARPLLKIKEAMKPS